MRASNKRIKDVKITKFASAVEVRNLFLNCFYELKMFTVKRGRQLTAIAI